MHTQWLADDNGIELRLEEEVSTITDPYEAIQYAEILARTSRESITVELKAKAKAWQLEEMDVITIESKIRGWIAKPFSVREISIGADGVGLKLVEFQHSNYPWSAKTAAPDYLDTTLKNPFDLNAPSGLSIVNVLQDALSSWVVSWDPSNQYVTKYLVQVELNGVVVTSKETLSTSYTLINMGIGSFNVKVYAVNDNATSSAASVSFDVTIPSPPTLNITASNFELQIEPQITGSYFGVKFELLVNISSDFDSAVSKGTAGAFTLVGLKPATPYYLWARTINSVGVSAWSDVITADTTSDATDLELVLGEITPRFTWTVYSEKKDGTTAFFATNTGGKKFQGQRFNMPTALPADLTGENANYAFYDWRTLVVANLAEISRDLGSITSGIITGAQFQTKESGASGARVVLNNSDVPIQVWDDNDNLAFGVGSTGSLEFAGSLGRGSIKSKDDFTDELWLIMFPPVLDASGGSADAPTSGSIVSTFTTVATLVNGNGSAPSISVNFNDGQSTPPQSTPTGHTTPVWALTIKRRVNSGAFVTLAGYDAKQFSGTFNNEFEFEATFPYWGSFSISINLGFTDDGLVASDGDTISYQYTITHVSGSKTGSANLSGASMVQSYQGGTGAVAWGDVSNKPSTIGGYGITDGITSSDSRLTNARQSLTDNSPITATDLSATDDLNDITQAGFYFQSQSTLKRLEITIQMAGLDLYWYKEALALHKPLRCIFLARCGLGLIMLLLGLLGVDCYEVLTRF